MNRAEMRPIVTAVKRTASGTTMRRPQDFSQSSNIILKSFTNPKLTARDSQLTARCLLRAASKVRYLGWLGGAISSDLFFSAGTIHNEAPNGTEDVIHSLQTYVASGDSMKGVIVIIPDVFGWVLPNVRLLADGFARKTGLTVYVPDFMSGRYFFFFS